MILSRRLLALTCAAAAVGATALPASPALAVGNAIINDCQAHGQLTSPYTVVQLRHALSVMPASVKQYTSCFDVVQNALVSARKHNGTAPVSGSKAQGSSFLPTPVIIILVVLILAALTFGALAIRRRRAGSDDEPRPGGPDGPGGAVTRRMPSAPSPSGGGDTAETRAMPAEPGEGPPAPPTRIDERADEERP